MWFFGRNKGDANMTEQAIHLAFGLSPYAEAAVCGRKDRETKMVLVRSRVTCPECLRLTEDPDMNMIEVVHLSNGSTPAASVCGLDRRGITLANLLGHVTCPECFRLTNAPPEEKAKQVVHSVSDVSPYPTSACGRKGWGISLSYLRSQVTCPDCLALIAKNPVPHKGDEIMAGQLVHLSNEGSPLCGYGYSGAKLTDLRSQVNCPECLRLTEAFRDADRTEVVHLVAGASPYIGSTCGRKERGMKLVSLLSQVTCPECLREARVPPDVDTSDQVVHLASGGGVGRCAPACGRKDRGTSLVVMRSQVTCPDCLALLSKMPPATPVVHYRYEGEKAAACGMAQPAPEAFSSDVLEVTCLACLKSIVLNLNHRLERSLEKARRAAGVEAASDADDARSYTTASNVVEPAPSVPSVEPTPPAPTVTPAPPAPAPTVTTHRPQRPGPHLPNVPAPVVPNPPPSPADPRDRTRAASSPTPSTPLPVEAADPRILAVVMSSAIALIKEAVDSDWEEHESVDAACDFLTDLFRRAAGKV